MGKAKLIDLEEFKALLLSHLEELENLSKLSDSARQTVELDQQSIGRLSRQDALQQQEMAKAQEVNRRRQIGQIKKALNRINENEYGYCAICGDAIPDGRLLIDPATEACVNCIE